ncbi:MAG: bis(5'-nucleosyl)-tetraphosphatase (symmetrical) YqeK [Spirochaetales bacterium]|nr:bis(5'-nucleosyl)-tetraphosphatase (symmetrical) YqeK [Spirochaetales bacterium]
MIEIYESIYSFIKENLSKKRQNHSFGVSKLAESLCKRYDIDPVKGLIAGISHDIAREFGNDKLAEYATKDGNPLLSWEVSNPILLHGRAGAEFIKERWHIDDSGIIEAIRYHTSGKPGAPVLSQILFVSDYLEPGRKFLTNEKREEILRLDLKQMMLFVLNEKLRDTKRKKREIIPMTLLLYKELTGG